jgi:hypothetical protein
MDAGRGRSRDRVRDRVREGGKEIRGTKEGIQRWIEERME